MTTWFDKLSHKLEVPALPYDEYTFSIQGEVVLFQEGIEVGRGSKMTFEDEINDLRFIPLTDYSFPKLEKGNKATDWTPAPEDYESTINSVSLRLDINDGIVSNISSRTSDLESQSATNKLNISSLTTTFEKFEVDINDEIVKTKGEFQTTLEGFSQNYVKNAKIFKNLIVSPNLADWNIEHLGGTMFKLVYEVGISEEGRQYILEGQFDNFEDPMLPGIPVYDIYVNIMGHEFHVEANTSYNLTEKNITVTGDGVSLVSIEMVYLQSPSETSIPRNLGIITDTKTDDELDKMWTVFDYNAPANTLTFGRSDNPIEMKLSNSKLQFTSKETGQEAFFSHSGMYTQQWTNDQHMIKAFSENGVTGTVWADKGSEI